MSNNFNYIFHQLKKQEIALDKTEFLFQMQSHPDFPSILSIVDTLSFFNIQNEVIRIRINEIDLLPIQFIALIKDENKTASFYYIERHEDYHLYSDNKSPIIITREELETKWDNLVLLVEKPEIEYLKESDKNKWFWLLPSLFSLLFVVTLWQFNRTWNNIFFLLFPSIGIILSVVALKDLFGTKNDFFDSFCNITVATDCSAVVGSKKWKIFDIFNFSDLSIVFFSSQILCLVASVLLLDTSTFFSVQKILLVSSLPVIIISIYYQKNVEKKWCPICLMISSVLILEWVYLTYFYPFNSVYFQLKNIIVFVLLFIGISWFWSTLKKILIYQKELKEFQLIGNRFMRNYEIFKNTLLAKSNFDLPDSPMILGNKDSETEITIITSPFCGHCEKVHKILDTILLAHNDLKIKIIISLDIDDLDEEKKFFSRSLMSIYLQQGSVPFIKALQDWFEYKNLKQWIEKYQIGFDREKIDNIYKDHFLWCQNNSFNFTPNIFINGYQYPRKYDRENLEFYINELVDDNFFSQLI